MSDAFAGYRRRDFRADLLASLPVAAVALPQSMAFAMLAGFPPRYGVYTSIVAGVLTFLFGSSRHMITSVNNAVCLMVASLFASLAAQSGGAGFDPLKAIVMLAVLVGVFELLFVAVGLVKMSQFISHSVLQGFMLGTALLIASNQLPHLLGSASPGGESAIDALAAALNGLSDANGWAVGIGAFSVLSMIAMPRILKPVPGALVAVIGSAVAVKALGLTAADVPLVESVPRALPRFTPPALDSRLIDTLLPGALAVSILGAVEAVTIGSVLAGQSGQRTDNNRQLFGQGIANIGCALFGGLPCSASFTRSFLNLQSGARTHLAGLLSSVWILLVVLTAGPLIHFVPKAALAGVLVVLAFRVPHWDHVKVALRVTKSDAAALVVTFLATLFVRLDTALFIGVAVSLSLYLRKASSPELVEYVMDSPHELRRIDSPEARIHKGVAILHVEGELFFGAAEVLEREVQRLATDESIKVLILRLKNARNLDATSVLAIRRIAHWLPARGRTLLICGVRGVVETVLERGGIPDLIGRENFFITDESILLSTRDALLRAKEILGDDVELRVFFDGPRNR